MIQNMVNFRVADINVLFQPLDRDLPNGFSKWQVLIAANDEDGGPTSLRNNTEVIITLTDINDNAPFLDMVQPVKWDENQMPGIITQLNARDYDSEQNGPPFIFTIADSAPPDIIEKFAISGKKYIADVLSGGRGLSFQPRRILKFP